MQLENEAHDVERIAKAFRLISKEICDGGLANALLGAAIDALYSTTDEGLGLRW